MVTAFTVTSQSPDILEALALPIAILAAVLALAALSIFTSLLTLLFEWIDRKTSQPEKP